MLRQGHRGSKYLWVKWLSQLCCLHRNLSDFRIYHLWGPSQTMNRFSIFSTAPLQCLRHFKIQSFYFQKTFLHPRFLGTAVIPTSPTNRYYPLDGRQGKTCRLARAHTCCFLVTRNYPQVLIRRMLSFSLSFTCRKSTVHRPGTGSAFSFVWERAITTRDVEAFLKKTAIAYHLNPRKRAKLDGMQYRSSLF